LGVRPARRGYWFIGSNFGAPSGHKGHESQHQENEEKYLGNSRGGSGDSEKAEDARDQCNDEKYSGEVKHRALVVVLSLVSYSYASDSRSPFW
jgi:hypothetical protein